MFGEKTSHVELMDGWGDRPANPTGASLRAADEQLRERIQKTRAECTQSPEEFELIRKLVQDMPWPLREQYPYLWLYEAQMLGIGAEQAGQVDLVFGSEARGGMVRLAVVEAKSLGLDVKGRTARTRRTFKRQKVWQQAISGIRHVIGPGVLDVVQKLDLDIRVTAFTWTEEGLTNVSHIIICSGRQMGF